MAPCTACSCAGPGTLARRLPKQFSGRLRALRTDWLVVDFHAGKVDKAWLTLVRFDTANSIITTVLVKGWADGTTADALGVASVGATAPAQRLRLSGCGLALGQHVALVARCQ